MDPEDQQGRNDEVADEIRINWSETNHLNVNVSIEGKKQLVLLKGPYDTGSQISFLSGEVVREELPELWDLRTPYRNRVSGVGGQSVDCLLYTSPSPRDS